MEHVCKYCGRPFNSKQQREAHEYIHEGKRYACDRCSKDYGSYSALSRHKFSHKEQNDVSVTTMFSMCGNEFYCGLCNISFSRNQASEYNNHLDNHVNTSDFGKHMYSSKKN